MFLAGFSTVCQRRLKHGAQDSILLNELCKIGR